MPPIRFHGNSLRRLLERPLKAIAFLTHNGCDEKITVAEHRAATPIAGVRPSSNQVNGSGLEFETFPGVDVLERGSDPD